MFRYNSVSPTWNAIRFACRSLVASEANNASARSGRVVYGVSIPPQHPRAAPPLGCFALTCFLLVTFLDSGHPALRRCAASSAVRPLLRRSARAKKSNPLAGRERKTARHAWRKEQDHCCATPTRRAARVGLSRQRERRQTEFRR